LFLFIFLLVCKSFNIIIVDYIGEHVERPVVQKKITTGLKVSLRKEIGLVVKLKTLH